MGIQFTVACNWDPKLIDGLDYPEIASLFGGLSDTVISSGRYSGLIHSIDIDEVKDYVRKVHQKGWNFDYNINSACMGNKELSANGHQEILKYLESVVDLGVDSLTVSIPNLLLIVKKYFPHIKTKISTFQKIDSVNMARRFEDLGADSIMLSEHVNRDLEFLRAVREAVQCKLILVGNVGCIFDCPNMHSHSNSIAHGGAKDSSITSTGVDSYQITCALYRLKNPVEFIRTRWIRPEDLHIYEELGIDMIKIIDRHSSTEALIERVKAYHQRRYQGNFIDLIGQIMNIKTNQRPNMEYIFAKIPKERMEKVSAFMNMMRLSVSDLIYLDSQKIPDDFLQEVNRRNCRNASCKSCHYCDAVASQAIQFSSEEARVEIINKLTALKDQLTDGSMLI